VIARAARTRLRVDRSGGWRRRRAARPRIDRSASRQRNESSDHGGTRVVQIQPPQVTHNGTCVARKRRTTKCVAESRGWSAGDGANGRERAFSSLAKSPSQCSRRVPGSSCDYTTRGYHFGVHSYAAAAHLRMFRERQDIRAQFRRSRADVLGGGERAGRVRRRFAAGACWLNASRGLRQRSWAVTRWRQQSCSHVGRGRENKMGARRNSQTAG
jgi:hypothetical protein